MRRRKQKVWVFRPPRPPKPEVPENVKIEVETKAGELVESFLKPNYIKPPRKDERFNYIVDIYAKWYRSYFHFIAKYACPAPNCIAPFFEAKFARMEYIGNGLFNLSYMRYTEQWLEIYTGLSVDECLAEIKDDPHFLP
jgi:hypothetical protein